VNLTQNDLICEVEFRAKNLNRMWVQISWMLVVR